MSEDKYIEFPKIATKMSTFKRLWWIFVKSFLTNLLVYGGVAVTFAIVFVAATFVVHLLR